MTDEQVNGGQGSLVRKMAERFHVEPKKLMGVLKSTAFKQRDGSEPTNEQMMALLVVADQYKLNPFTREIFAFADRSAGIVPVVSVDGWARIINSHPALDGFHFEYAEARVQADGLEAPMPEWCEVHLYRNDRSRPVVVREYFDEVYRPPVYREGRNGKYQIDGPWQSHPRRMHRHKALIQGSRYAFGFAGIYDEDEASRIMEAQQRRDAIDGHATVVSTAQGQQGQQGAPGALEDDSQRVNPLSGMASFGAKVQQQAEGVAPVEAEEDGEHEAVAGAQAGRDADAEARRLVEEQAARYKAGGSAPAQSADDWDAELAAGQQSAGVVDADAEFDDEGPEPGSRG